MNYSAVYFKPVIGDYTTGRLTLNPTMVKGTLLQYSKDQHLCYAIVTSEEIAEKLKSLGLPKIVS